MNLNPIIMQRTLPLFSFCALSMGAFAQLSPQQEAPLFQHMEEVNAEWRLHQSALVDPAMLVHYADEADRIAAHLLLVERTLEHEAPEGISSEQLNERLALLSELQRYADRGIFPQNHVLPYRNPIFIDPNGTACAVGQLMITSGAVDLATRIDAEMETAYIRDMHWPEIGAWANAHGFTGDELAWIQPGYAPPVPYIALGGGTDGAQVEELLRLENGDLIVAGDFVHAGNTLCNSVARWNGSDFVTIGSLPEGYVNCSIEFNGDIYLAGSFLTGTVDLLKWSGSAWEQSAVFSSKFAEITALHEHEGVLYAAGSRSGFVGIDHSVQRLINGNWSPVGQELNGPILTLDSFDGGLVAGGAFTDNFLSSGNTILHAARLNENSWQQIGDGLDGTVYDLLVLGTELYAGRDMLGEVNTYFGLARFSGDALLWTPLMPNIENYIFSAVDGLTHANALLEHDGRIFIGGSFYVQDGLTFGTGLAVFNGEADQVEPYADFGGPVFDLELIGGNRLVAGGIISFFGNLAATDLTTGIRERANSFVIGVYPNPAIDLITLDVPVSVKANASVRIIDATGRTVRTTVQRNGSMVRVDVRTLASGQYHIELNDGQRTATGTFLKQ